LSKARLAAEAETELMITVDMILVLYGFKKRYRLSLHKYNTIDITVQVFNNIIVMREFESGDPTRSLISALRT